METFAKVQSNPGNPEIFLEAIKGDAGTQIKIYCASFFLPSGSDPSVNVANYKSHGGLVFDYVEWILDQPLDDDVEDYENNGLQSLAFNICQYMAIACKVNADLAKIMALRAYEILEKRAEQFVAEEGGPAHDMRGKTLAQIVSMYPSPQGMNWDPSFIPNFIQILEACGKIQHEEVKSKVGTLKMYVSMYCPKLLQNEGDIATLLDEALNGKAQHWQTLAGEKVISKHKDLFFSKIDEILNADFIYNNQFILALAGLCPVELGGHVSKLALLLEQDKLHNMEAVMLQILGKIATPHPELVHPSVEKMFPYFVNQPICRVLIPTNLLIPCASQDPPFYFLKTVEFLSLPDVGPYTILSALSAVQNIVLADGVEKSIVEEHKETIFMHEAHAQAVVEKIKDWLAGRSLETIEKRVDSLEQKINEMNDAVKNSCANFDEVKKYIDDNIADVKDFVGEIVKKLPKPSQLVIIDGTVKKTLRLHFTCAKSDYQWTCETSVWKKWLKMGITLGKIGATALSVAGGNVGGLSKGPKLMKEAYELYKSSNDEDFNAWVTQPFLTSDEQDKLIIQLREAGFFEVFTYEAQLGDWVCLEGLGKVEKADYESKMLLEKQVASRKADNVVTGKSKKEADEELEMENDNSKKKYQQGGSTLPNSSAAAPQAAAASQAAAAPVIVNTGLKQDSVQVKKLTNQLATAIQRIEELESKMKELESRPQPKSCCVVS